MSPEPGELPEPFESILRGCSILFAGGVALLLLRSLVLSPDFRLITLVVTAILLVAYCIGQLTKRRNTRLFNG